MIYKIDKFKMRDYLNLDWLDLEIDMIFMMYQAAKRHSDKVY